MASCPGWPD